VTGLVNSFESTAGVRLFGIRWRVPPSCAGAPVLNDLGEVIGVVTAGEGAPVLSVDALDRLLTKAGFDRHG
jgi:hypothetical protein